MLVNDDRRSFHQRSVTGIRVSVERRHRILQNLLDIHVDTQGDPVTGLPHQGLLGRNGRVRQFLAFLDQQRFGHVFNSIFDIRRILIEFPLGSGFPHNQRVIQGFFIFFVRDDAVFMHGIQHSVGPVIGGSHIALEHVQARIVFIRALGKAGQYCAFTQAQLIQRFTEVVPGGHLDTVVGVTVENRVHVYFQNLVLVELPLQFQGQINFLDLPLVCYFLGQIGILDDLLGDGAAAVAGGVCQLAPDSVQKARQVEAVMLIEPFVFYGNKCVLEVLRHFIDISPVNIFIGLILRHEIAVDIIQLCCHGIVPQLIEVQLRYIFQILHDIAADSCTADGNHQQENRQYCLENPVFSFFLFLFFLFRDRGRFRFRLRLRFRLRGRFWLRCRLRHNVKTRRIFNRQADFFRVQGRINFRPDNIRTDSRQSFLHRSTIIFSRKRQPDFFHA